MDSIYVITVIFMSEDNLVSPFAEIGAALIATSAGGISAGLLGLGTYDSMRNKPSVPDMLKPNLINNGVQNSLLILPMLNNIDAPVQLGQHLGPVTYHTLNVINIIPNNPIGQGIGNWWNGMNWENQASWILPLIMLGIGALDLLYRSKLINQPQGEYVTYAFCEAYCHVSSYMIPSPSDLGKSSIINSTALKWLDSQVLKVELLLALAEAVMSMDMEYVPAINDMTLDEKATWAARGAPGITQWDKDHDTRTK